MIRPPLSGGVRDPICGYVPMYEHEKRATYHPLFVAAQNKKQLGCSDFEYPSAVHTRASHMIGTMYRASHMMDLLGRDFIRMAYGTDCNLTFERVKKTVRMAALYHDVGHGPFSHVCDEFIYSRIYDIAHHGHDIARLHLLAPKGDDYDFHHILETANLSFSEAHDPLGSVVSSWQTPNGFKLSESQPFEPFLHAIVQGPLGADRQDYLARDAHMTGEPCGNFDSSRLVSFMRVIPLSNQRQGGYQHCRLGVLDKGLVEIDRLCSVRANMFHSVYQNPNVVAPSLMIGLAVRSDFASGDSSAEWSDLFGSIDTFSELSDHEFVNILRGKSDAFQASVCEAATLYAEDFAFRRNIPKMIDQILCEDASRVDELSSQLLTRVVSENRNVLSSYVDGNGNRHEIFRDGADMTDEAVENGVLVHAGEFYQNFELDRLQKNQVMIVPREPRGGALVECQAVSVASYFKLYRDKVLFACPNTILADRSSAPKGVIRAFLYKDYDK